MMGSTTSVVHGTTSWNLRSVSASFPIFSDSGSSQLSSSHAAQHAGMIFEFEVFNMHLFFILNLMILLSESVIGLVLLSFSLW